jgi:anti-anti-sigma factor
MLSGLHITKGLKIIRNKSEITVVASTVLIMGDPAFKQFEEMLNTVARKSTSTGRVVIDFSDCIYIDSRAITLLISINRRLQLSGRQLRIENVNQEIAELLMTMQLDKIIEMA